MKQSQSNKVLIDALAALEEENESLRAELERVKTESIENEAFRSKYPSVLKAKHVAEILEVSDPTAYAIMRLKDFPSYHLHDQDRGNIRVDFSDFMKWKDNRKKLKQSA